MIAVIGFDSHRQANVLSGLPRVFGGLDQLPLRHRDAARLQERFGQVFVAGNFLGNGAGLVGLGGPDAALARAKAQLHKVALGQPDVWNATVGGCLHNVSGAGAQALDVHQLAQVGQGGLQVKGLIFDGCHHQVAGSCQCGAAHLLLARAKSYLVDTPHRGLPCFAKSGAHACQVLQFQRGVLENVRRPGTFAYPLQKTAAHTGAAMVLNEPGQPGRQPLIETRQGVGRMVFQFTNVDPGFNDGAVGPYVGATQVGDSQQFNVLLCHEYQQFWQSGTAGVIPDNLRGAASGHKGHMIIVIQT